MSSGQFALLIKLTEHDLLNNFVRLRLTELKMCVFTQYCNSFYCVRKKKNKIGFETQTHATKSHFNMINSFVC
jgi:hypothetical protein